MLPVSELVHVARTVTDEGSSPLALRAAEAWGYERVRFLRSSANHVFSCAGPGRVDTVLRFRPNWKTATEKSRSIAELSSGLASAAAPVAPALRASDGRIVVPFRGACRGYVASLFAAVAGGQLEAGDITLRQARAWGRALARLHEIARGIDSVPRLPSWLDLVTQAARGLLDADLRPVGDAIVDALGRLPTDGAAMGVVHGDAELDNVIWAGRDRPIFVDLDDASWSWFAADVCFALRDFAGCAAIPAVESEPVASFIAGYRERRPLADEELAWLPLFARAHALITLTRLHGPRFEPVAADWPEWARAVRTRLERVAADLRGALLSAPTKA